MAAQRAQHHMLSPLHVHVMVQRWQISTLGEWSKVPSRHCPGFLCIDAKLQPKLLK